tara:strand:- start:153 stop:317 length:165 start_codon:yes stop_codon:yes gene_type:complete
MTASKQAKELGLKSLTQVSDMTGQSAQTLTNWFYNKPYLFEIVLLGCKAQTEAP